MLERDGNNGLLRRYIYGARRIAMRSGTADYYYHYDPLGSVRNVTSAAGVKQWTDLYEPFGAIRTETQDATGAPTNFMKFAGEYSDPTGLYHLRARQYDQSTGRFQTVDPANQCSTFPAVSVYSYVNNRPTVMVDPTGATLEPTSDGIARAWLASSLETSSTHAPAGYSRCGSAVVDGLSFIEGWDDVKGKIFPDHGTAYRYWVRVSSDRLITYTGAFQVGRGGRQQNLTIGFRGTGLWSPVIITPVNAITIDEYLVRVATGNAWQRSRALVEVFSPFPCSKPKDVH